MTKPSIFLSHVLFILCIVRLATSRWVIYESNNVPISNLIDSGIDQRELVIRSRLRTTNITCTPIYGFLPCTTEVWGQVFMIVVYEYLLSLAGSYISSGSDIFFQIFGTGIFGASVFHVLGAIPQVVLLLASGITGSMTTVQSIAAMGIGLLAGTAIMDLTIAWGLIVIFGSYKISSNQSTNTILSRLTGYGVTTDSETKATARIMLISLIPLLLLQLATILPSHSAKRVVILATLIITVIFLVIYCTYQIFQPWIQSRRLDYVTLKFMKDNHLGFLLTPEGKPNQSIISELFKIIDQNNDTQISAQELRALMLGMQLELGGFKDSNFVKEVMEDFDMSGDSNVTESAFIDGLSKWISKANPFLRNRLHLHRNKSSSTHSNSKGTSEEQQSLLQTLSVKISNQLSRTNSSKNSAPSWWNYTRAGFLIIIGTTVTAVLAEPLMETFQEFSTALNLPSFFVSYILIPLALNMRQTVSAIQSAGQKTEKAVSLTLSEVYGGVFMNNILGLATFLALVYVRDLSWDVSAEVLVVLIICTATCVYASCYSKFGIWTSIVAFALYPISLAFLFLLTSVFGWG